MDMRVIIRWLVYAAVFLVPLWFLPLTADVLEFNKMVLLMLLAGVGLVLFLVDMIRTGTLRVVPSRFYWPIGGIVAAGIMSVVFSINRFTSLFGVGQDRAFSLLALVSLAILFFLAVNVIEDRGNNLRVILMGSLTLAFLFGVLQILGVHLFSGSIFGARSFNTVGTVNALGVLAAAVIPLMLAVPQLERPWQRTVAQVLRYAGLLLIFFLLALLNWSTVWIVAFISTLGYIAFTSGIERGAGKMKFYALPLAVIVIGIFLWIINFNWTAVKSQLPTEVTPTQRTSYTIARDAIAKRPMGYGLENYLIAYDQHRPAGAVNNALFQARFSDAVSEVPTMAAEGGILMLIALAAFLVFFVLTIVQQVRVNFGGDATSGKLWASALGLIVALFFYPFTLTLLMVLLLLIAAGVLATQTNVAPRELNLEGKGAYSFLGSVAFIVGLVAVLTAGYFTVNQYVAQVQFARAASASDRNAAVGTYVSSINSYNKDSRVYRALTDAFLKLIAEDLRPGAKNLSQQEFAIQLQNRIASVINVAVRATEADPSNSENWINRGYVYQNLIGLVNGADEAAVSMYQEAIKRSPANALAHVRIGNTYLSTSRLDQAEESYQQAIALYNNYGQALYNLAAVYDRKGELSQAIRQFERLQATTPNDPSILFQLGLLYYRNNQKDVARAAWERAVTIFPDYSNARWYLSFIYEEQGDLAKALAQVREIEKFNKDNQLVQERIAQLEAGTRTIPPEKVLDQEPLNNEQ